MSSSNPLEATQNEVLIESAFRQLFSSVQGERDKLKKSWSDIDVERANNVSKLAEMRRETDEWCMAERLKVEEEWKRLDKLRERMAVVWQDHSVTLEINCSGTLFSLPKSALTFINGSYLNHMFSDAFVQNIPRDRDGRFFLDFNPVCFGLIVSYLQSCMERPDAKPPPIPPEQHQNMTLLAEALQIEAFVPTNKFHEKTAMHGTSLRVSGGAKGCYTIEAAHTGWQVIAAAHPISMASIAYFEVTILENCEARGGLAIGYCGHAPQGPEVHTIRLTDCVMYNSGVGLIGDAFAAENVNKGIVLTEGATIGVKHDPRARRLEWFFNRMPIGTSVIKQQNQSKMVQMYPVVALGAKPQRVEVNFVAPAPLPHDTTLRRSRE